MARRRTNKAPKPKAKGNGKTKAAAAPTQVAGTTAGSNVGVRADIMRTAFRKLWECDRDIAALKAQHIKPVQEERGEIWKTLRNDLDAKAADLKPLYDLYKRDRQLTEIEDEETAGKSIDTLREAFQTLQEGETLNFLSVLGGTPKATETNTETARSAGYDAGAEGANSDANPYDHDSDEGIAWEEGRGRGLLANLPGQAEVATAH